MECRARLPPPQRARLERGIEIVLGEWRRRRYRATEPCRSDPPPSERHFETHRRPEPHAEVGADIGQLPDFKQRPPIEPHDSLRADLGQLDRDLRVDPVDFERILHRGQGLVALERQTRRRIVEPQPHAHAAPHPIDFDFPHRWTVRPERPPRGRLYRPAGEARGPDAGRDSPLCNEVGCGQREQQADERRAGVSAGHGVTASEV